MEPTSSARMILFVLLSLLVTKCHSQRAADWMSGKHGIGFRIPGGVNMETAVYDVSQLVKQIKDNIPEITWVLLGISSGAYGDQYTSPHSILTNLNRASTPRQTENVAGLDNWMTIHSGGQLIDFELEKYPERDLFAEIADAFHAEGFKVIAYMAAQGPTFLKHGERKAYDYANKSKYVDSVAECKTLTDNVIQDGKCSPSARKWKNYVLEEYGSDDDTTLQTAWAEKILGEYVNKFDGKNGRSYVDAWWFDQGSYMNIPLAHSIIKTASPNALIAFNDGQKVPLMNNNPGLEDFTGGHPTPITQLPPYDDTNEAIIKSVESTSDGYVESDGFYSLGHVFQMTNSNWNNGNLVWNGDKMPKAIDWMSRTLKAHGAWTWNVKRQFWPLTLHPDDIALVKDIIAGLKTTGSPTPAPTTPAPTTPAPTTPAPTTPVPTTPAPTTPAPTTPAPTTPAPTTPAPTTPAPTTPAPTTPAPTTPAPTTPAPTTPAPTTPAPTTPAPTTPAPTTSAPTTPAPTTPAPTTPAPTTPSLTTPAPTTPVPTTPAPTTPAPTTPAPTTPAPTTPDPTTPAPTTPAPTTPAPTTLVPTTPAPTTPAPTTPSPTTPAPTTPAPTTPAPTTQTPTTPAPTTPAPTTPAPTTPAPTTPAPTTPSPTTPAPTTPAPTTPAPTTPAPTTPAPTTPAPTTPAPTTPAPTTPAPTTPAPTTPAPTPGICNAKNKGQCAKEIALGCVFMNKKCVQCSILNLKQCEKSGICIVKGKTCAACSDMKGSSKCVKANCSFKKKGNLCLPCAAHKNRKKCKNGKCAFIASNKGCVSCGTFSEKNCTKKKNGRGFCQFKNGKCLPL